MATESDYVVHVYILLCRTAVLLSYLLDKPGRCLSVVHCLPMHTRNDAQKLVVNTELVNAGSGNFMRCGTSL